MKYVTIIGIVVAFANIAAADQSLVPTHRVQEIMASMIKLQPPGFSTYSRVHVDPKLCEPPKNEREPSCEKPSPLCGPPDNDVVGIPGCTRSETWEEGMRRYRTIAESIHRVAGKLTFANCQVEKKIASCISAEQCGDDGKCKDQCAVASIKKCRKSHPWNGRRVELETMLTVIAANESGFRKDIQTGTGAYGLGDCQWEDLETKRKVRPWTSGGQPILTTCHSFCMGQINFRGQETLDGRSPLDLVGESPEALDACFEMSADFLSRWRGYCMKASWLKKTGGDWAKGTFVGYGTGSTCVAPPQARNTRKDGERVREYRYKHKKTGEEVWSVNRPGTVWSSDNGTIDLMWVRKEDPRFALRAAQYWRILNHPRTLKERELEVFQVRGGSKGEKPQMVPSFHDIVSQAD